MKRSFRCSSEHRNVWRSLVLCAFLLTISTASVLAQTPQFVCGGGTGGNYIPFAPSSSPATYSKWQGFYVAGNFPGAYSGLITKVYFQSYAAYNSTTYANARISFAQTTSTTFSTTAWHSPMTQAFFATSVTLPAVAINGWFSFTLQTPYPYNPSQSLVIEFCSDSHTGDARAALTAAGTSPPNIHRIYGGTGCNGSVAGAGAGTRTNFGFDLSSAYNVDAGINALNAPVNFCASTQDIKVNLMNYGQNTLNNVTIKWNYDGTPQTDIAWTGALASLANTEVVLGNRTFAGGVPHTLKVWTHLPNNVSDSGAFNDTLSAVIKPALSGTFTVGGAAPNYPSFAAVAADLNANGICGPVVFNVRSGTYTEQCTLSQIAGASSTNTITFQSESGNRNDVTLTYAPTTQTGTVNMTGGAWTCP